MAGLLTAYRGRRDVVVLGLARGGVPVAREIAGALDAPLDALIIRKLGVPGHEEYAMGAIGGGGHVVVNADVVGPLQIPRRHCLRSQRPRAASCSAAKPITGRGGRRRTSRGAP